MSVPNTKVARLALIVELLETHQVKSQPELRDLLSSHGVDVTQATMSRDLLELGAVRLRDGDGHLVYVIDQGTEGSDERAASARLTRVIEELVVGVEASANLVVVRTPPGAAQFLASSIDHGGLPGVIGSVAGDDTVLLITKEITGGEAVVEHLLALSSARR
jgi:transcriptional regulator of arginine metabolism